MAESILPAVSAGDPMTSVARLPRLVEYVWHYLCGIPNLHAVDDVVVEVTRPETRRYPSIGIALSPHEEHI